MLQVGRNHNMRPLLPLFLWAQTWLGRQYWHPSIFAVLYPSERIRFSCPLRLVILMCFFQPETVKSHGPVHQAPSPATAMAEAHVDMGVPREQGSLKCWVITWRSAVLDSQWFYHEQEINLCYVNHWDFGGVYYLVYPDYYTRFSLEFSVISVTSYARREWKGVAAFLSQ